MGRYKNTDKAKTSKQTERSVPSFRFAKRGNARTQDEVCFEETKSARKLCLFLILFRFDVSTVTLRRISYRNTTIYLPLLSKECI